MSDRLTVRAGSPLTSVAHKRWIMRRMTLSLIEDEDILMKSYEVKGWNE